MMEWLSGFGRVSWTLVKYTSVFYVFTNYFVPIEIAVARGDSMEPTISDGDVLVCEKQSVRRLRARAGDIVLFTSPEDPDRLICKRIKCVAYAHKLFTPVTPRNAKETETYQIGVS